MKLHNELILRETGQDCGLGVFALADLQIDL